MNKSQRIYFDTGSTDTKYVTVRLEQGIETLEFMSMNLNTKDVYQDFNADYGVLVGKVTANEGVGIPNAKISIFIPLLEEDENNGEIKGYYPYTSPRDINQSGRRYNLLPRVSKIDPTDGTIKPKQAFGSFPIKEEILTNDTILEVYKKYYRYTTTTNDVGDYMIFGVPVGTQTVHMSVDITDIGEYSMTPATMVTNLGYSENLFTDGGTKIKPSSDLDDLPHIETREISVDIVPFWGDTENFEIGISRQDFRVRASLTNTFVIFGSAFTDGPSSLWGDNYVGGTRRIGELYRAASDANETVGIHSKRIGKITEKIYYYPPEISDTQATSISADPTTQMLLLDPSEYTAFKRDGDFIFIINCNRDKIITDEFGNKISVPHDSPRGVFTTFRGFVTLELTKDELSMERTTEIGDNTTVSQYRYKLKFPQYAATVTDSLERQSGDIDTAAAQNWRRQHKHFEAGKFYSFARFHPTTRNHSSTYDNDQFGLTNGFFNGTVVNWASLDDAFWNVGIIVTATYGGGDSNVYDNADAEFPANTNNGLGSSFGANWINLSVYLPQLGRMTRGYSRVKSVRTADHFHPQHEDDSNYNVYFFNNNTQQIAAGDYNTKHFPRTDLNWTDIIEVPLNDIQTFRDKSTQGFIIDSTELTALDGSYRSGDPDSIPDDWASAITTPCPYDGGKAGGDINAPIDPLTGNNADTNTYFYKGFGGANCIEYLYELNIIT